MSGQKISRKGLFKKEVENIVAEDTPIVKEIEKIEREFRTHTTNHGGSGGMIIQNSGIGNVLLYRIFKILQRIEKKADKIGLSEGKEHGKRSNEKE